MADTPNFSEDLLLVTCASGKQASALLPFLSKKWKRLRLAVGSPASQERLQRAYPQADVVTADFDNRSACFELMKGVAYCFLVLPPFVAHASQAGINMIDAALAVQHPDGSLKHLIFSSVIHPCLRKLLNHDNKRYVEEYLIESGLQYTITQPSHMMEMLPLIEYIRSSESIVAHQLNWPPEVTFSFTSTRDIAGAVANILDDPAKHTYATYQLVSDSRPLSYNDVAKIAGDAIGKEVKIKQLPFDESLQTAKSLASGFGKAQANAARSGYARLMLYYNERGLLGNSNVMEMLLGRKPLTYDEWARIVKEES